jgi:hypothetical protein
LASAITELQTDAMSDEVPIETVLKKAKLVAVKLGYPDIEAWCDRELDGYLEDDEPPPYRKVRGELRARELNGPTMPIIFKDAKESEIVNSPRSVGTSAGQLERMRKEAKRNDTLSMPLPADFVQRIFSILDWRPQEIRWVVDPSSLGGIVSAVRKVIFDWSLKLETAGIQGDGISFDELAKRKAHEPAVINSVGRIEKFYGVIGNASGHGSTINLTQTFDRAELSLTDARSIVGQIEDVLGKLKMNSTDRDSIASELTMLNTELETANPDQSKIRAGFKSVLETVGRGTKDAAKDIFAAGVTAAIKTILGIP